VDIARLRELHPDHWTKATAIRTLAMDAVQAANSGHPGMPMGMADVATVLFEKHLKFDAAAPEWPDRDRFVLSAGHGSMLLYALLYLVGDAEITLDQIKELPPVGVEDGGPPRELHGQGHRDDDGAAGPGSRQRRGLRHRRGILRARFGKKVVDHYTYVIAGDGCLMEGISHEAIGLAGMQKLNRLIVLWDDNNISIDGEIGLSDVTDQRARFAAAGWHVLSCDGHDPADIDRALTEAKGADRPVMIACKTHIGYGAPGKQDTAKAHGSPLGADVIAKVRKIYGWPHAAFEIPADVKSAWEKIGARGRADRAQWTERFATLAAGRQAEFNRVMSGEPPRALAAKIRAFKKEISATAPKVATRKSSEMVLEVVNARCPRPSAGRRTSPAPTTR
jgi:transketolase